MDKLKIHILRRLYDHTHIGARYTPIENMTRGLPPEERSLKELDRTIRELWRDGLILLHKKGGTVSLNPHMLSKIRDIIGY